jgi:hypothetical protein
VKELLSAVGSGGGAAAPAAGGAAAAAAGGAAAEEEKKEEAKEEGELESPFPAQCFFSVTPDILTTRCLQRRRSPTRTWVSVSSTKMLASSTWARCGVDSSGSLCSSDICMDLRRRRLYHLAHMAAGLGALVSGILVHGRSLQGI